MRAASLFYCEKDSNREEEEKVRGERLTGGPRVKNMLRGGGITRVGGGWQAGLAWWYCFCLFLFFSIF